MGLERIYPDERKHWVERTRRGSATAPSAGADILVVENDYQCKLTELEIAADRGGFFNVIIRDQDKANPTTRWSHRLPTISGGGEPMYVHREGTFEDPILKWGAKSEIAIQNVASAGSGEVQSASITLWELNP